MYIELILIMSALVVVLLLKLAVNANVYDNLLCFLASVVTVLFVFIPALLLVCLCVDYSTSTKVALIVDGKNEGKYYSNCVKIKEVGLNNIKVLANKSNGYRCLLVTDKAFLSKNVEVRPG